MFYQVILTRYFLPLRALSAALRRASRLRRGEASF
jgi:hypothetical protein